MTTYCIFNTGYEHAMHLGTSRPHDISLFGGKPYFDDNWKVWSTNDTRHSWSASDVLYIHIIICNLCADISVEEPVWEEYEKTCEGTYKLFRKMNRTIPNRLGRACLLLGCVIFHQLMYEPKLLAVCTDYI